MERGPKIGLDKVYIASLTSGTDVEGGTATYGAPVLLSGAASFVGNPNGAMGTDWGDNGQYFTMNTRGNMQATLDLIDVDPVVKAQILGQTRANGVTQETPVDQSPYYAVGFRVWIGGSESGANIYEYVWYLKGKFAVPEDGGETYKGAFAPKHTILTAEFVKLVSNGNLSTRARSNASDVVPGTITNWFNAPVLSASMSTTAVTLSSGAGSISGKTITLTFGKSGETFSLTPPISPNAVTVSVVSTGLILAGTYTYTASAAGAAPTLTIANANIAGVAYLVTVTNELVDSNGVGVTKKSILVTPA